MSEAEPKKGPGRPPKQSAPPPAKAPTAPPPLEEQAQRNAFSTMKLLGRFIGSTEQLAEEDFEDIGRGVGDLARLFPAAAPGIKQAVQALGPTATALDLIDKLSRVFSKSKLKDQMEERIAAARRRGEDPTSAT